MWTSKKEGRSPWIHINPIIAVAILSYIISAKCGRQKLKEEGHGFTSIPLLQMQYCHILLAPNVGVKTWY